MQQVNSLLYVFYRFLFFISIFIATYMLIYVLASMAPVPVGIPGAEGAQMPGLVEWLLGSEEAGTGGVLRGDLGLSLRSRLSVGDEIALRMGATMELLLPALILSLLIGGVGGVLLAALRMYYLDGLPRFLTVIWAAMPLFWLALMLISALAMSSRVLPVGGRCAPGAGEGCPSLEYMILPLATLVLPWSALVALYVRGAAVEAATREKERNVGARHMLAALVAFPLPALPVMVAGIFSSLLLVETVFAWPGLGRLMMDAASFRDNPMLVGIAVAIFPLIPIVYFVAHLLYALFSPLLGLPAVGYTVTALPLLTAVAEQQGPAPLRQPARPDYQRVFAGIATVVAVLAALFVMLVLLAGLLGPTLTGVDPMSVDVRSRLLPPGSEGFPLGADELGRDVMTRLMMGSVRPLLIGLLAAVIALGLSFVPAVVGALADSVLGGVLNAPVHWLTTLLSGLPLLPLALLLLAAYGPGEGVVLLLGVLLGWTQITPLLRAWLRALRRQYEASRPQQKSRGKPRRTEDGVTLIDWDEIEAEQKPEKKPETPGCGQLLGEGVLLLIYAVAINMAFVVLLESAVSFLGFGVQPPEVSWGAMLAGGRSYLVNANWLVVLPGLMITLTVLSLLIIAERIRETFRYVAGERVRRSRPQE